jgi:hypothetical protein
MKPPSSLPSLVRSAFGPKAKFKVRKEPFGLSLSKPRLGTPVRAEPVEAGVLHEGFVKLSLALRQAQGERGERSAQGLGDPTVVNSRFGPTADARLMRCGSRATWWIN